MSGIVIGPSTITFATALPDTVPNNDELITATLPGPPAVWLVSDIAKSMKSWPVPLFSMNAPKITKSITYDAETPSVEPKMLSVDRSICSIRTGSFT